MSDIRKENKPSGLEEHIKEIGKGILTHYENFDDVIPYLTQKNINNPKDRSSKPTDSEFQNLLAQERINIETFKNFGGEYEKYLTDLEKEMEELEEKALASGQRFNDHINWGKYLIAKRNYNRFASVEKTLATASFVSHMYKLIKNEPNYYKKNLGLKQIRRLVFTNPDLELYAEKKKNSSEKISLALKGANTEELFPHEAGDTVLVIKEKHHQKKLFIDEKRRIANKVIEVIFKNMFSQCKTGGIADNDSIIDLQYLKVVESFMDGIAYQDLFTGKSMSYKELNRKKIKNLIDTFSVKESRSVEKRPTKSKI